MYNLYFFVNNLDAHNTSLSLHIATWSKRPESAVLSQVANLTHRADLLQEPDPSVEAELVGVPFRDHVIQLNIYAFWSLKLINNSRRFFYEYSGTSCLVHVRSNFVFYINICAGSMLGNDFASDWETWITLFMSLTVYMNIYSIALNIKAKHQPHHHLALTSYLIVRDMDKMSAQGSLIGPP